MIQLLTRKLLVDNLNVKGPREPLWTRRPESGTARAERRTSASRASRRAFDDGTGADRFPWAFPRCERNRGLPTRCGRRCERVPLPLRGAGGGGARRGEALFSRLSSSVAADGLELPLPALHTDGLDAEQVWQQIEMQLEPLLVKAKRALKRLKPTIEADDDLSAARLFTLPASMAAEQEEEGEGVEWEPFDEGVEYDVDGDEEADASEGETESSEGEEEEKDDREDGVRREDTSSADVTAKYFKNPGMFSLTEMENFALQAEKAEEKRLRIEALREEKRAAGVAGDDGSESESEDDPILEAGGSDSGSDSGDDGSESSSEDEEMDELLGNTARLAGVDPARRASNKRGSKAAREKKGKDIMFEDFFGQAPNAGKKKGLSGMKGLEADELSEEEEDIFNEMERGEMEGDDDDDEEEEDGGLEDEDALRRNSSRNLPMNLQWTRRRMTTTARSGFRTRRGGGGGGRARTRPTMVSKAHPKTLWRRMRRTRRQQWRLRSLGEQITSPPRFSARRQSSRGRSRRWRRGRFRRRRGF